MSSQIMWRNAQRLRSSWRSIPPVLKATSKVALRVVSPALLNTIVAWRGRRRCRRLYGPLAAKVRPMLYGEEPVEVLSGPFKGLKFAEQSDRSVIPKWVGSYESQLHPVFGIGDKRRRLSDHNRCGRSRGLLIRSASRGDCRRRKSLLTTSTFLPVACSATWRTRTAS